MALASFFSRQLRVLSAPPRVNGIRRHAARIVVRMLAFNVLVVFLPVAGLFYLGTYAQHLLEAQERGMVQQGRLLAAALAAQSTFDEETVGRLLHDLNGRVDARLRVIASDGRVFGDTSVVVPGTAPDVAADAASASGPAAPSASAPARGAAASAPASGSTAAETRAGASAPVERPESKTSEAAESKPARERLLYRIGAWLAHAARAIVPNRHTLYVTIGEPLDMEQALQAPEIQAALAGRYGSATRLTRGQRSVTLYSAIPIRRGDAVVGVVLVSESTYRLLQALYDVRLRIFEVIVSSLVAAALLSMFVAATIARPLRRLQADAATVLDHRGRLTRGFRGTARWDEIGDLARALEALTNRFEEHLRFVESFSADLSHEFKNPLASIRTVADILGSIEDPDERQRFVDRLLRDLTRLERLLAGVQEIVSIDTQLERDPVAAVDLGALLANILDAHRLRTNGAIRLQLQAPGGTLHVRASPERLAQVFDNLVDNAVSFSQANGLVTVTLARQDGQCRVAVSDEGPGIPEAHLARIFERFFSYRPNTGDAQAKPRDRHTGLGLSIARAIIESYGGSIAATNRTSGGTRIDVSLPAL
jgi:two-component system sensor histidine kinase ChvG